MNLQAFTILPPRNTEVGIKVILVLSASLLNTLINWLNNSVIQSPLFLDSIFTALVGALYGPLPGLITGLTTNVGMEIPHAFNFTALPFAPCNMATGLIVGLIMGQGRFPQGIHVTLTILLVTLANAVLGAIIANLVFSGDTGFKIDVLVNAFVEMGQSLGTANFWARIPANLVDKMIAVYTAFGFMHLQKHPRNKTTM